MRVVEGSVGKTPGQFDCPSRADWRLPIAVLSSVDVDVPTPVLGGGLFFEAEGEGQGGRCAKMVGFPDLKADFPSCLDFHQSLF